MDPIPGTPEEQDALWFEKYYRGDRERQLTWRAVIMGGVLGMFMAVSNLYTTLKIGWGFGVSITACVISYVIWNNLCSISGGRLTRMTMLENNCMQSTATAAGVSTGGTLATAFGSLLLIHGIHQPWPVAMVFVGLTAALGVFLAIPMKRQMINHEQLKFPTGIATAETLRSLYSHGGTALKQAYSLLISLGAGAVIGLLHTYGDLLEQLKLKNRCPGWLEQLQSWMRLPENFPFPQWMNPLPRGHMAGYAFEPSVLLIGAGMITGLRVSLSMFAGSVLLYLFVAPHLAAMDVAQAGVAGYVASFKMNAAGDFNPMRWALWGGTSVMVFSSLAQIALNWRTVLRAFSVFNKDEIKEPRLAAMEAIEVPVSWLIVGLVPIGIGLLLLQYLAFQVSLPLGLISIAMAFVVSLVCCRATGETDTTPIGAMGKVTQLLYAVLPGAKGIADINLMAAGVTAGAGGAAADLLTDLKSGYLLGANPRKQFLAQFAGVFFGVLAVVPAWYLMVPDKPALEAFNPPATYMWKAASDLLTQGVHMLPRSALVAIVIGALTGVLLPVLEKLFPKMRPYLPSAMGLGLAWVVTFQNSLSFVIGAAFVALWEKIHRRTADTYNIPIASGLVAGESLVAAFIAIACTLVGFLTVKP
ncbi:MAG: OPT family oligopeptide transporter [Verrucomicrobiota bacterium]